MDYGETLKDGIDLLSVCATMIKALDHIQLAMPPDREEDARRYFGDLLGMVEELKPAILASRGGCWFQSGQVVIHLGVEQEFCLQKKAHPALVVADLDGLAARLAADNYPVDWDDNWPERRRFYSEDPFGNRIEFMERKKDE